MARPFAELRELTYRSYEASLDLDIAMTLVSLNAEERERMGKDEELAARILILDAKNRMEMIISLRDLAMTAKNEGVRLSAIEKLGKTYYPQRFKQEAIDVNVKQQVYRIIGRDGEVEEVSQ